MKEKTGNKLILGILALSFAANLVAIWEHLPGVEQRVGKKTEVVYDTIPVYYDQPVPRDSVVVRYSTVKLPASESMKDTVFLTAKDTVEVTVPITQKVYEDSLYKAWVSGFQPSLDSILVYRAEKTVTVTQPLPKQSPKRWGLGVQAGAGLAPGRIEPYVGIGISYNIFSW